MGKEGYAGLEESEKQGAMGALPSAKNNPVVCRMCALMLVVLVGLSAATGARTLIIPMKACPYIKSLAAVLLFLGSVG